LLGSSIEGLLLLLLLLELSGALKASRLWPKSILELG
jgi:hypothetical protein